MLRATLYLSSCLPSSFVQENHPWDTGFTVDRFMAISHADWRSTFLLVSNFSSSLSQPTFHGPCKSRILPGPIHFSPRLRPFSSSLLILPWARHCVWESCQPCVLCDPSRDSEKSPVVVFWIWIRWMFVFDGCLVFEVWILFKIFRVFSTLQSSTGYFLKSEFLSTKG